MRFRYFILSALVFLAACDHDDKKAEGIFPPPVAGKPVSEMVRQDFVHIDNNEYDGSPEAGLELSSVDETPGRKHHTMIIKGKEVSFTASAGHVIAYAPKDPKDRDKKDAQAAMFYAAYTRDDLPRGNRPVTFFFNGGPGSSTIWLHMGSWAPKRLHIDSPVIPAAYQKDPPKTLPLIDNQETLLEQSDLVFVDALGTGYSEAIKPHKNHEFWGVEEDAKLFRDFITSYNNKFNRQSSPKYIYGESYGGIRGPILANLLQNAGTTSFEPDPSGKPPVILSGLILNSPILDYGTDCTGDGAVSCAGFLPTYGMVGNFHGKSTAKGGNADYLSGFFDVGPSEVAQFKKDYISDPAAVLQREAAKLSAKFEIALQPWLQAIATEPAAGVLSGLAGHTGIAASEWARNYNMSPGSFRELLMPGYNLGRYDSRIKLSDTASYGPDDYEAAAFVSGITTLLPDFLGCGLITATR